MIVTSLGLFFNHSCQWQLQFCSPLSRASPSLCPRCSLCLKCPWPPCTLDHFTAASLVSLPTHGTIPPCLASSGTWARVSRYMSPCILSRSWLSSAIEFSVGVCQLQKWGGAGEVQHQPETEGGHGWSQELKAD
jgi:hypothetical protein